MHRREAIMLLEQALERIRNSPPTPSADVGSWQAGGAYWRLAKVLGYCLDPVLEGVEGKEHANFLRATHGALVKQEGAHA